MRALAFFLRFIGYLWGILVAASVVVGLGMTWWQEGFWRVQEIMNPFNLWQHGLVLVLLLPSFGFLWLADRIDP